MTPVAREAIASFEDYQQRRAELRPVALATRQLRTFQLGAYLTFQFENRTTVRYQVQEMIRVERISREADIQHELDTYNELLGGEGELGCTLLIGVDDPGLREELLPRWLDLPGHFYLKLADGRKVRATWDPRQVGRERVSSVQFLKFDTGGEVPVAVGCDHADPLVSGEIAVDAPRAEALKADLEDRDAPPTAAQLVALAGDTVGPNVGQLAPGFTLPDSGRSPVSLAQYRGRKVVLAFFPAAFTGVCTAEVCTLRDGLELLNDVGADVLGVSADSPFSLAAFAAANDLNFPLLSDYSRRAIRAYRVELEDFAGLKGYSAAQRSVFVIDAGGRVAWRWIADSPGQEPDYAAVKAAVEAL